ncbi:site-specific DNA-methyltransferase [Caballeronia sordidicola]|uniref:site-specific DNA-methyltransferase (adenine-specific) n=1 Tax=Caballeronia sordidicola TaxID=196367 RepID=A0A242MAI5_CABSO|nr:DNA methyltransferase [Caballeronia sordidicola]OTP68149.1 Type III restriction-modification system methylation subunit [Caballeronia sordidicola]
MSRLTDLIAKAKANDLRLGVDLDREFKILSSRLPFGLNFERHSPEAVELPLRPIRKGDKVRVLPERLRPILVGNTVRIVPKQDLGIEADKKKSDKWLWQVRKIAKVADGEIAELQLLDSDEAVIEKVSLDELLKVVPKGTQRLWHVKAIHKAKKTADLELLGGSESETQTVALGDLVVVAEFRDTIFPGLISTGTVQRGGDKPCHTVINGENYHVLKALTYTHRGTVDAVYIDPPYNTGAKDWKYNNDYVEKDDLYRHSKWLAMIERRLLVAKELLNPADSVLIVTIDEKEYLRLGLLLEQLFPEARIQMVSSVINPKGVPRDGFSRVDEYIFVAQFGTCEICGDVKEGSAGKEVRWRGLTRTGANGVRGKSPGAFYPIFFNIEGKIVEVGDSLPLDQDAKSVKAREGLIAVWPTPRPDGEDGRWSVVPDTLRDLIRLGAVRTGKVNLEKKSFPIFYLTSEQLAAIEAGDLIVQGKTPDGVLKVYFKEDGGRVSAPRTVWDKVSHSASEHGSMILRALLPGRKFPFPKSLYAVEDVLRLFVRARKTATILDFFAGSGTTAHAVMRLNRLDGGKRQCISVTNNEVAAAEQEALCTKGIRPGDADWEQFGICDYITKPRIKAAITGETPDGKPINDDYKFTDEFPMVEGFEENAEFFTLTYETPISVSHNLAFARIAPLLWMRAGARGRRIDELPADGWAVADAYGLLTEVDAATPFIKFMSKAKNLRIAYLVTDDDRRFQAIAKRLPDGIEPVRLYESYLSNFSFANGE